MFDKAGELIERYQIWGIAIMGILVHVALRRDVPLWQHIVLFFVGAPLVILLIVPTIDELFHLERYSEMTVTFVLATWGRDIVLGVSVLMKRWSNNPMDFLKRK